MAIEQFEKQSHTAMVAHFMYKKFPVAPFNLVRHRYIAGDKACEDELNILKEEQEQYRINLNNLAYDDLEKLYVEDLQNDDKKRFFHQEDTLANYRDWSKKKYWTMDEGIALLLCKNPQKVSWKILNEYTKKDSSYRKSPFVIQYKYYIDLAMRQFCPKTPYNDLIPSAFKLNPSIFLGWAKSIDIKVSSELLVLVRKYHDPVVDKEMYCKLKDDFGLLKKEPDTLQSQIQQLSTQVWKLDPDSSTYSKKLDIALQAYRAVSANLVNGKTIKQQALDWINTNHREITNEAKEDIAKVVNWDQSGQKSNFN